MKFYEAMKLLDEGKKVRRKSWPKNEFYSLNGDETGSFPDMNFPIAFRDEWEIFTGNSYSFTEILPLVKQGKRFKRPDWEEGKSFGKNKFGSYRINLYGGEPWDLKEADIEGTDWFEVDE